MSERQTIAELEKILDEPDLKVEMRPDGEIRSVSFRQALTGEINRFSKENGSDTPDFMLAEFLADCLMVFDKAVVARDRWYGHVGLSHGVPTPAPAFDAPPADVPQTAAEAAIADAAMWPERRNRLRIYLAARYARHLELQGYAARLTEQGHEITSRWIRGDHELRSGGQSDADEWSAVWADEDLEDLQAADVVINFTEEPGVATNGRGRGGRHVELGAALAWSKKLVIVGPREHVFHYLPQVEHFQTFDAALAMIGEPRWAEVRQR